GRSRVGRGVNSLNHTPLGPNQCAYCKKEGHWKSEWPQRRKSFAESSEGGQESDANLIMLGTSD
ncbi:hypothetical protein FQV22_0015636, partial [Spheniscus magellanicus]